MPGELVDPSLFAAPMSDAAEKENEHVSMNAFPVAPGNKPLKKRNASTTRRAKKTKPRAPFSSKKRNAATSSYAIVRDHHVLNPFEGCNVSFHESDHRSVQAVAGSASKAKAAKADEPDNHSSMLHHVEGSIRSHHAAGVRTPHGKGRAPTYNIRTPLLPKRMGVDGTYKTPSKDLLRSTACSRGHEHHPHQHQRFPLGGAVTTDRKTKKAREIACNRYEQRIYAHPSCEKEDIALFCVPHVTFRGQVVQDTTFDADLVTDDDDISALSIHLDFPYGKHWIDIPDCVDPISGAKDCDKESAGSLFGELEMSVARELELCHLGSYECIGAAGAIREGAQNPIATTLHAEHFVMTEKLTMRHPVVQDLLLFTAKKWQTPGGTIAGDCAIRPSVRHGR